MKKFLGTLLLLTLTISSAFSQKLRDDVVIQSTIFKVVYSEVLQQPKKIEYRVECTETKFSRDGLDFYTCDSIKTSDHSDYAGNEWDKGHLAPAAAFSCDKDKLKTTFSYLNCALQQENLNRGVWRLLEAHERNLAKGGEVKVVIELHFSKESRVLPTGATIPDGFTKKITQAGKTTHYYFPNTRPTKKYYTEYEIKH